MSNDCEDQGMTAIADGCPKCHVAFIKEQRGRGNIGAGNWFWKCPSCKGYFGPVTDPTRAPSAVEEVEAHQYADAYGQWCVSKDFALSLARRLDEALAQHAEMVKMTNRAQDRAEAAERKLEEAHIRISNLILNGPDADSRTRRAIGIALEEMNRFPTRRSLGEAVHKLGLDQDIPIVTPYATHGEMMEHVIAEARERDKRIGNALDPEAILRKVDEATSAL